MPEPNPGSVLLGGQTAFMQEFYMGSLASSTSNKGSPPREASLPVQKHLHPVVPLPIKNRKVTLSS